jgi:dienelactone hydrolase
VLVPAAGAPAATGRVLVVGDSLVVGTTPYLRRELSGASVTSDGRIGRPSAEAVSVLRAKFNGSERVVVFDAGTNDDPSQPGRLASDLSAARSIAGSRCLVVATVNRPPYRGVSVAGLNAAVQRFASGSSNVQLVDWRSYAVAHPGLINPDGVHPTASGYAARARLFAQAIDGCGTSGGSVGGGGGGGGSGGLPPPGTPVPPSATDQQPPGPLPHRGKPPRGGSPAPGGGKPEPSAPPPKLGSNAPVFDDQPVSFDGKGARLRGELLLPTGGGRSPAVVMIQGSGPATREPYREQAEYLAQHGIAALIYDKRGAGQSTGDPDYHYDQLAGDASAAVALLRRNPGVRPDAIGLWGLSEGGWVAPMVAAQDPGIKALMVVSSSALPPAAQQDWSVRNALDSAGAGNGGHVVSTFYRVATDSDADPDLGFQPAPVWGKVAQPVLAVWGGEDRIVPVRASAAALDTALASGPNRDRTFRTFPGASHSVGVAAQGNRPGSAPGFKELSVAWLRGHLLGRTAPRVATAPLPPPSGTAVVRADSAGPLDRWPVQLVWLLLPALALVVTAVRALLLRRRAHEGLPALADWWPLAGVVVLDLLAFTALGIAVASIVTVSGQGVDAIAGVPAVVLVAWAVTLVALIATLALARWARRREGGAPRPALAVCGVSAVWLLLLVHWLV